MASVRKLWRRFFNSNSSLDSGCYDVHCGIQSFIQSGTSNFISKIGMQLDEEIVQVRVKKELISRDSASSSDESDGNDSTDNCDEGVVIRKGVKISGVNGETFAHGFGLRDDDIIISVNNKPVKSVAMVASMVHGIIKYSKNSRLRMEIHRKERGLIVLDNGGDDVCAWDDDELICIDNTRSKLKNVRYKKYLRETSSKIVLSNFKTPPEDKLFIIKHYAKVVGSAGGKFVAVKHNKTNKWLQTENGTVTLGPAPPGDGHTLPTDSKYLMEVFPSSVSDSYETLQPVNENGKAIGIATRKGSLTLLPPANRKTFFQIFTS